MCRLSRKKNQPNGVGEYNISNANLISNIWEITDLNNVSEIIIEDIENVAVFKSILGEEKRFIAFNQDSYFEPIIEGETTIC